MEREEGGEGDSIGGVGRERREEKEKEREMKTVNKDNGKE